MRAFLNSPVNGLFAGGIIFALGLHLGGEKCDLKKFPSSCFCCFMSYGLNFQKHFFYEYELGELEQQVMVGALSHCIVAYHCCIGTTYSILEFCVWKDRK